MNKLRLIILTIGVLCVILLLSACTGQDSSTSDTVAITAPDTESPTPETDLTETTDNSCTTSEITANESENSDTESATEEVTVQPLPDTKGENKVNTLHNYITNMNLGGEVGNIITANEKNWIHKILEDNPGLFDTFLYKERSFLRTMWNGEFPGKLLTGIAQTYLTHNDEDTRRVGDAFVDYFKRAQERDGYLGPWSDEIRYERDVTEENYGKWDTWGIYHCVYGLYRWYQVTGNQDALEIATRALDNVYEHFIEGDVSIAAQNWAECNLAIGHAFALFYEETGDERYLAAAERLVNQDWNDIYRDFYTKTSLCCGWMNAALEGKAFFESGQPRWEGLYALETLATLYRITGKEEYNHALSELWWGIYETDRHNTGSLGTGEGATGDIYGSGSETCNTIAWMAFSTEYLKISKDSRVADELELSFFNATLGSLLGGERNYTYMNNSDGFREPALVILAGHSYTGARDMSCCQANGNRGLSQITEWALLCDDNNLYLNYYGKSSIETFIKNGYKVTVVQDTVYPKNGTVNIRVITDCPEELTLNLRIPSWSENTTLTVNGEAVTAEKGKYCSITRKWNEADKIELGLDMTPHFWIREQGEIPFKLSVYSGPVLLAFKTSDSLRGTTRFSVEALRNMTPIDGDGLVSFTLVSETGKTVILTDYYTAGKDGSNFVSWLTCISGIAPLPSDRNGTPIWCNR